MKQRIWFALSLVFSSTTFAGCQGPFYGECEDDEDLRLQYNYHEGAICVDGHPECPGGGPFCPRIKSFGDEDELIQSCTGPCIECPNEQTMCAIQDLKTKKYSFFCVESQKDCWSNDGDQIVDWKQGCPTQAPECR